MVGCALCGCTRAHYFPITKGTEWTYSVQAGLIKKVIRVNVSELTSANGFEASVLKSSMGNSVLYWQNDNLFASELSGTRFKSPILLFISGDSAATAKWEGLIEASDFSGPATAQLSQKSTSVGPDSNKKSEAIEATLTVKYGKYVIDVRTVYVRGLGIYQQEQRLNGKFASSLDHVSGP